MNVHITPGLASGTVVVPPSKSMAHRMLIAAALSSGNSRIRNLSLSEDIRATIDCLRGIGTKIMVDETVQEAKISGVQPDDFTHENPLCCRESGSTLRFLIPLLLTSGKPYTLTGYGRLMQRPMDIYESICQRQGLLFEKTAQSIHLQGTLQSGLYDLPGDISSQFISGLMFALPLLEKDSHICPTTALQSGSYLNMTVAALRNFGIRIRRKEDGWYIPGSQCYTAADRTVEGDFSNAAFPDALNFLGGSVQLTGLPEKTDQGDSRYRDFFGQLLAGTPTLDVSDCPDLAPVLMALAAALHGAVLTGTARLQLKESDRGAAMAEELHKFGITLKVESDRISIPSGLRAPSEPLNGHNDHRIVMALAVLLTRYGGEIRGAEAVRKSYPEFFLMLRRLNIEVTEYEN